MSDAAEMYNEMQSRPASLIEMLNNHLPAINEESNKERDNTYFHPSTIGFCSRKIAYIMHEFPAPDLDPRVIRIFENGHSMHERFENWFDSMGIQIAAEVELSPDSPDQAIAERCRELDIRGKTDSLIEIGGEYYLVELKSANDRMFKNFLQEPKEQHVEQLQLYMYLSGVHQGFLLYENKNDQSLKEFLIEYDEEMVNRLREKILNVNEHVNNNTLPEREFTRSHWQCKYCDFSGICWYPDSENVEELFRQASGGDEELLNFYMEVNRT